jgi:hypothetical protein
MTQVTPDLLAPCSAFVTSKVVDSCAVESPPTHRSKVEASMVQLGLSQVSRH